MRANLAVAAGAVTILLSEASFLVGGAIGNVSQECGRSPDQVFQQSTVETSQRTLRGSAQDLLQADLSLWAWYLRMCGEKSAEAAADYREMASAADAKVGDSGDRLWADEATGSFLVIGSFVRKYDPGHHQDVGDLEKFVRSVQNLNRRLLIPRGWLMIPQSDLRISTFARVALCAKASIDFGTGSNPVRKSTEVPVLCGESVDILTNVASDAGGDPLSVYFGPPQMPTIFVNTQVLSFETRQLQEVINPGSLQALKLHTQGFDCVRRAVVDGLTKDGWLERGLLRPGFDRALEAAAIRHEATHFVATTATGFGNENDEAYARLTDLAATATLRYFSLADLTSGVIQDATSSSPKLAQYRASSLSPTGGLLVAAWQLATVANYLDLVKKIEVRQPEALCTLCDRLMGYSPRQLIRVAERARSNVKPKTQTITRWRTLISYTP